MDQSEREASEVVRGSGEGAAVGSWALAWRAGVVGGIVFVLAQSVVGVLVYGVESVVPRLSALGYVLAVVRNAVVAGAVIAMLTWALSRGRFRQVNVVVQAVLLGLAVAALGTILDVTISLIVQVSSDAGLSFAWDPYVAAIGRQFVQGFGLPLFLGISLGWVLAHRWLPRNPRRAALRATPSQVRGHIH